MYMCTFMYCSSYEQCMPKCQEVSQNRPLQMVHRSTWRNVGHDKKLRQFRHMLSLMKNVCIFCHVFNEYVEDMATFITLAKIYSTKYFWNIVNLRKQVHGLKVERYYTPNKGYLWEIECNLGFFFTTLTFCSNHAHVCTNNVIVT